MELKGKCRSLRIYLDEDLKWKGRLLYRVLVEKFLKDGLAGATVFKGVEGYGSSAHIHSSRLLEVTENLPVLIEVVDRPRKIEAALRSLEPMLPPHCLVTVQEVEVLYYDRSGKGKKAKRS